jgi:metallo-beta-lactamase family protein
MAEVMTSVVRRTVERGGKVLIPAFSLGRTQLVVHYLQAWMRTGRAPEVPIFVDSPMAAAVAEVHRRHPECLTPEAARFFVDSVEADGSGRQLVHYVRSAEESRELSERSGSCVIVAASGMCEAGRIVQHLKRNFDDPRCSILLVSYQAPGSLGRRLLEPRPTVYFHGRRWNLWADVVDVQGFSGHADQDDLRASLGPLAGTTRHVRLVHGELEQAEELGRVLRAEGFADVRMPALGESVSVT